MKKIILSLVVVQQIFFCGFTFAQSVAPTPVKEPTPISSPTVTFSHVGDSGVYGIVGIIQEFGGWLLLIAGALAIVMVILGGVRYMVSMGNPQQTEGAKKTIMYALIGLIVIVLSGSVAKLVTFFFTSPPQPQAVKDVSAKIKAGEVQGKVSQCQYNGKTVFNVPRKPEGRDAYISELLDTDGKLICYTDGGMSGKGDLSKCPGFDPAKCPAK